MKYKDNIDINMNKSQEIQVLSGIAILSVVLIHSNAYYLQRVLSLELYTDASFKVRLLDNFIRAAVPIFIFISGYKYYFNGRNKEYNKYIKFRLMKVIKPFTTISIIFLIKKIIINYENISIQNVMKWILGILVGYNTAYQLWYIPMYIFIIISYPIIYKNIPNFKFRLILFVSLSIVQEIVSSSIYLFTKHPFDFIYYYIYFEWGVLFCKYKVRNMIESIDLKIILFQVISCLLITVNLFPDIYIILQKYFLWPICVVSYYLISIRIRKNRLFNYLGKYSFYIFLFHEPVICTKISEFFYGIGFHNSIFLILPISLITILLSIVTYFIIKNTFINNLFFIKN